MSTSSAQSAFFKSIFQIVEESPYVNGDMLTGMIASPLQIFKVGTHTDGSNRTLTFTAAELAASAAAYDPQKHEAPLVVGHPSIDAPAYGWAHRLLFEQGALEAVPHQVDADFAALVNDGHFKKISASFWLPTAPGNPVPGVYYLRHIGFLGAAAPAVKGLRTPTFSDADDTGVVTLEFSMQESFMADNDALAVREAMLAKTEAELKAKADAQAALDQALKAREDALAKAEAEAQRKAATEFAEAHVKDGRLLPRQQAGLVELLLALPPTPLEFAQSDGQAAKIEPRAWVERFVSELPVQVDYAERSAATEDKKPPAGALARKAFEALDPAQRKAHLARGGKVTD